jgi:signal transduction histidine kinase
MNQIDTGRITAGKPFFEQRFAQFFLRNVSIYLIFTAIAARTLLLLSGEGNLAWIVSLLALYGVFLVASHWLENRRTILQMAYLVAQSAFVLAINPQNYKQDYFPILFIPLSLQAVLFFGRRQGFFWIGAFSILALVETLISWQGQLTGLVEALLYAGLFFFTGNYGHLIRRTEATRQQNQHLMADLQVVYHQLQEYSLQMEQYTALEERNRMARELHDSATQTIFSLNLAAQTARLLARKQPSGLAQQLDRIQELARSAAQEVQALSSQLDRSDLAGRNFPGALRRLVDERRSLDDLDIRLVIDGERDLGETVAAGLYRITQEALNNVSKHAQTGQATIHLHLDRHPACLEIADHGAGFELGQAAHRSGHFGLQSMAERAGEINWKLSLDSHPGRGTTIRIEEVNR